MLENLSSLQTLLLITGMLGTALAVSVLRNLALKRELQNQQTRCAKAEQECSALRERLAAMEAERNQQLRDAEERIGLLQESERRLSLHFENLANRIFEEKQQAFSRASRQGIESLLEPLSVQLREFRGRIEDIYDTETRERASLRTEINMLKEMNQRLGREALNLARALKGDSKTRGNWGEIRLQRILEESGLKKGREYDAQVSLANEEGRRLQPDIIVHLPEGKDIVIDSKVSLVAYERYHSSEDEKERQAQLKAHISSIRKHIRTLSEKDYNRLSGIRSLDMVIMFVPLEPALLLALEHDPELFNHAFSREILLAGPSTLMATLQIIYNIWRHEYQNRHALEIATEAGKLHDQFVLFAHSLEKTGQHLHKALESFETTRKRLITGRGNLVRKAHALRELGARAKKNMPGELLEAASAREPDGTDEDCTP